MFDMRRMGRLSETGNGILTDAKYTVENAGQGQNVDKEKAAGIRASGLSKSNVSRGDDGSIFNSSLGKVNERGCIPNHPHRIQNDYI